MAHDFAKTDELRALLAAALSEASPSQEDPLGQPNKVAVTEGASTTPCVGENGLNEGTVPKTAQSSIRTAAFPPPPPPPAVPTPETCVPLPPTSPPEPSPARRRISAAGVSPAGTFPMITLRALDM
jgi:hypothetical protein